jgi:hypothetical protein
MSSIFEDLKSLEKLFKICRRHGVEEITSDGVRLKFGNLPSKTDIADNDDIPTDELTPDQLMFYATQGNT